MGDYVRNIDPKSYGRFGDPNKIGIGMAKRFFAKKEYRKPKQIDGVAQELSEVLGIEVTPQDIVEYMETYQYKIKVSPEMISLQYRFKEITGLTLNDRVTRKALQKRAERRTKEHEQQLEALTAEAATAEQAEREYYESIREGRISVSESETTGVREGTRPIPQRAEGKAGEAVPQRLSPQEERG